MDELYEMLGAKYDWVWFWHYRVYAWTFLYWPAPRRRVVRPVLDRRPMVIRAGFVSGARGRHWKRNKEKN